MTERIEKKIDEIMMSKNQKTVFQLQRKMSFFQILDRDLFFNDLNRLSSFITIDVIRKKIQTKFDAHIQNIFISSSSIFFWNEIFFSILFLTFIHIFSLNAKRILKSLPKFKRLRLTMTKVLSEKKSIDQTIKFFGVNKDTFRNRIRKHCRSAFEYKSSRCKLTETEKLIILKFVDKWSELEFSFRFEMIKEKILKFFKFSCFKPRLRN